MAHIHAYKDRGIVHDIILKDAIDNAIDLAAGDKLRAIIKRLGQTALLTVTSDAPTANGSSFTIDGGDDANEHRLRLDASDLTFSPGVYTLLIDYYDDDDADEWKSAERFVFSLEDT